ncbi:MAG: prepilin-type N-terminal cleavage/methylation domain-containing protein, partial [Candidatus Sumerlaeia bacterium]|nr:prepilin-type N-terminal cleavage/methylation domain-containing protein [Candidatus Sumerlaeia bacterium]
MKLRTGFTLIELLIVVAIIAILAAIAVPNFLEAQTRAKVARVNSDLRSLATAIEAYRVDNNDYPEGTDNVNNYDP